MDRAHRRRRKTHLKGAEMTDIRTKKLINAPPEDIISEAVEG